MVRTVDAADVLAADDADALATDDADAQIDPLVDHKICRSQD
jgi:hypothetical protein